MTTILATQAAIALVVDGWVLALLWGLLEVRPVVLVHLVPAVALPQRTPWLSLVHNPPPTRPELAPSIGERQRIRAALSGPTRELDRWL
jgi:hypothetical protein